MSGLLAVACPVCPAQPGERCMDRYRSPRKVHDPRARAARGVPEPVAGRGDRR